MCFDPASAAMIALNVAGTGLQAGGQLMAGRGSARAARLQAWMADRNATMELRRGAFEEARVRDRADDVIDGQQASVAARGFDPVYGSPLVAAALTTIQAETDALLTRAGGQQAAAQARWQGVGALGKAADAQRAGYIGAGATLLKGAGSLIAKWPGLDTTALAKDRAAGASLPIDGFNPNNPFTLY